MFHELCAELYGQQNMKKLY